MRTANSQGLLRPGTEDRVRRLVSAAGLTWDQWQANTRHDIEEIAAYTDERWQAIAKRAIAIQPDVFASVPDPIILINGKYLVTQNTARRGEGRVKGARRTLRTANWLIRQELERNVSHDVAEDDIVYRNQLEPEEGQVVRLKNPHDSNPDKIDVEWLYTYVSEDGQISDWRWVDNLLKAWSSSVYRGGVWEWKLTKTPAGQWSKGESEWTAHHRTHQSLILAWDDDEGYERSHVHVALYAKLWEDPSTVQTERAARIVVRSAIIDAGKWARKAKSHDAKAKMDAATARALDTGDDKVAPQSPVFIIDGTYRVDGASAGGTTEAFQILNWIIRQRVEGNW